MRAMSTRACPTPALLSLFAASPVEAARIRERAAKKKQIGANDEVASREQSKTTSDAI